MNQGAKRKREKRSVKGELRVELSLSSPPGSTNSNVSIFLTYKSRRLPDDGIMFYLSFSAINEGEVWDDEFFNSLFDDSQCH